MQEVVNVTDSIRSRAEADTEPDERPVSDLDRRVYAAIAAYAPDEPICWPSQALIASEVGCSRVTVNHAVRRLRAAGWLRIIERRLSRRTGWRHNVYELLAPFAVSALAMKRITRRAHKAAKRRIRRAFPGSVYTNKEESCPCRRCRPEKTSIGRPPPPVEPVRRRYGGYYQTMKEIWADVFHRERMERAECRRFGMEVFRFLLRAGAL